MKYIDEKMEARQKLLNKDTTFERVYKETY